LGNGALQRAALRHSIQPAPLLGQHPAGQSTFDLSSRETGGPSSRPELCTDAPGFDRRAFHQQYDAERSASSDIADTAPKPLGPERLAA